VSCKHEFQTTTLNTGHCSQDGPPHTQNAQVSTFCKKENVDFTEPGMWLSNSPDVNPVDYSGREALQQRIYYYWKIIHAEELK